MTSLYMEDGRSIACTLIEAGPCVVTQVKTVEKEGYNAVQIGYGEKKKSTQLNLCWDISKKQKQLQRKIGRISHV